MADTTYQYTPGAGAAASIDRITGTDYPHYKVKWGSGGTVIDADIVSGKPFPIQLRGSDGTDRSNLLPVSISGTPSVNAAVTAAANAFVDGAIATLGLKADAKNAATDTTALTLMQVAKQLSACAQLINTALGVSALTRGTGPSDANSLNVHATIDDVQLTPLVNGGVPVTPAGLMYSIVPASTADFFYHSSGLNTGIGSLLDHFVCSVDDPTDCEVRVADGSAPGGAGGATVLPNNPSGGVGVYHILMGGDSAIGTWRVSTGAGVSLVMFGIHP